MAAKTSAEERYTYTEPVSAKAWNIIQQPARPRPTSAGQTVIDETGTLGITTTWPAARGSRKGQIGVMYVGGRYEIWDDVDQLRVVTVNVQAGL